MVDERFPGNEGAPPYLGGPPSSGQVSERMQSLLARAVEDQMAEQRQLQLLVNDIRTSLAQLQEEVRQSAGALTLDQVRTEVGGLGTELRSSTTMLGERLEAVVRALNASAQAVQGMAGSLERANEMLGQQQQALAALPGLLGQHSSATEVAALRTEVVSLREAVRGDVAGVRETTAAELARLQERLVEHVDSAVLALAEALLRRRATDVVLPPPQPPPVVPVEEAPEHAAPVLAAPPAESPYLEEPELADEAPGVAEVAAEDEVPAAEVPAVEYEVPEIAEAADEAGSDEAGSDEPVEVAPPGAEVPAALAEDAAEAEAAEEAPVAADPWVDAGEPEAGVYGAAGESYAEPAGWLIEDDGTADQAAAERAGEEFAPSEAPSGWDAPPAPEGEQPEPPEETDEQKEKRRPWWRPGG